MSRTVRETIRGIDVSALYATGAGYVDISDLQIEGVDDYKAALEWVEELLDAKSEADAGEIARAFLRGEDSAFLTEAIEDALKEKVRFA